jgi:DNA adenine methylase
MGDFMRIEAKPVVKWAGGKSKVLNCLIPYFPAIFNNYHEPFFGGGAVYFDLFSNTVGKEKSFYISDLNDELINLYKTIRDDVERLIILLRKHKYDETYYYAMRKQNPNQLNKIERASRMLYLNKTCFNGLWRVNRQGQFNVSFGRYENPLICDDIALYQASLAFQCSNLFCADFEKVLLNAESGDFVYLDPPYYPVSSTANFTSYTANMFNMAEHVRLKKVFDELSDIGCYVALSNSDTAQIKELYENYNIKTVKSFRSINSDISKRGSINELLILSYGDECANIELDGALNG